MQRPARQLPAPRLLLAALLAAPPLALACSDTAAPGTVADAAEDEARRRSRWDAGREAGSLGDASAPVADAGPPVVGDATAPDAPSGRVVPATSCAYADVVRAIDSAASSDTVAVPAGSCTWSSTLPIRRGVRLLGAGAGRTTIMSRASGFLIEVEPADPAANAFVRISGFTFDLGGGMRSGIALSPGNTVVLQTQIRIDHNRFQNIAQETTQQMFILNRGVRGVVDNNDFAQAGLTLRHHSNPVNDGTGWGGKAFWDHHEGIVLGQDENNLWFEDNTFRVPGTWALSDCVEGLRYAFRYNTIHVPDSAYHQMFDMHGNNGQQYSCMGTELYGNDLVGAGYGQLMDLRGGRMFAFNNRTPDDRWSFQLREERLDSTSPVGAYVGPNPPQYPQHISGTYLWGNRGGSTGRVLDIHTGPNCVGADCISTDVPKPGRDFFAESTSPGVTCGRPEGRPTSCAVGEGYWATLQSCTDLTGMVGAHPASPIAGTLYRCAASGAWDEGRSPLAYPHPLTRR